MRPLRASSASASDRPVINCVPLSPRRRPTVTTRKLVISAPATSARNIATATPIGLAGRSLIPLAAEASTHSNDDIGQGPAIL